MKNLILLVVFTLIISCNNSKQKRIYEETKYVIIYEKTISMKIYKIQVIRYCAENKIYIDFNKIDSMYYEEDPRVGNFINK